MKIIIMENDRINKSGCICGFILLILIDIILAALILLIMTS